MSIQMYDLEKDIEAGTKLLEKNPDLSRRVFLGALGLGVLSLAMPRRVFAKSEGENNPDEKYYFYGGSGYAAHIAGGVPTGKDFVIGENTLVTAMAEGRVIWNTPPIISIEHFGGRYTEYHQVKEIFVDIGDYVGRNSLIGMGGLSTPHKVLGMSPLHVHINYIMTRGIFNLVDRGEYSSDDPNRKNVVRLDPEARGQKEYGLKLWKGEDLFSEPLAKRKRIVDYLDSLAQKAPLQFHETLRRAAKNVNLDSTKVILFDRYLKQNVPWLTPEEKQKVAELVKEYANLWQPLTLPFVNPALDKIPGFYRKVGTARTLDEFRNQYREALKLIRN